MLGFTLCAVSPLFKAPSGGLPGPSLTPHHLPASISVSRDDPPHGSQGDLLNIKSDGTPSEDFLSPLERSPGPCHDPKALQASAPAMSPPAPTMPPFRLSTAATLFLLFPKQTNRMLPLGLCTSPPSSKTAHLRKPHDSPLLLFKPPPREACLNHPRDETPPHPPPRAVSPADGRCLLSCCPSSSPAETSQMLSLLTILLSAQYLTQRRCLISTGALTATRAD